MKVKTNMAVMIDGKRVEAGKTVDIPAEKFDPYFFTEVKKSEKKGG